MLIRFGIPLIALSLLSFATASVLKERQPRQSVAAPGAPPISPYAATVSGVGLIEPASEIIAIGTHLSGVVEAVAVRAGQRVAAGDLLFVLDTREPRAAVREAEAALRVARDRLTELEQHPRSESIPPAEAALSAAQAGVREALADVARQRVRYTRIERAAAVQAASQDELEEAQIDVDTALARLDAAEAQASRAQAELTLLLAGSFAPSVAAARSQVQHAEAALAAAQVTLERTSVHSPIDGAILRVDIRPGEFAQSGALAQPLLQIGATDTLHVRVDIDEFDAPRARDGASATAYVRGDGARAIELDFVRFEPYIVPKRSLTGLPGERVDTRVLQAIYRIRDAQPPVFVGQQVDVFIESAQRDGHESEPISATLSAAAGNR